MPPPLRPPPPPRPLAILGVAPAPLSPRSHEQAITQFSHYNRLDAQAIARLRAADPRIAVHVMAQGPHQHRPQPKCRHHREVPRRTPSRRAPRQPNASPRRRRPHPYRRPPSLIVDPRREGIQARAIRANDIAAARYVLITHPDPVYDADRRGRTALHLAADSGLPTLAILLPAARSDVNARANDGYTPFDCRVLGGSRTPALPRMPRRARRPLSR